MRNPRLLEHLGFSMFWQYFGEAIALNSPERQEKGTDACGKTSIVLTTCKILDKFKLLPLQITAVEAVVF